MSETLIDRGPDGHGVWLGADDRVGFAHRRLSIIAPGRDGAQPMHSSDGAQVITYNGEVYNFRELRAQLASRGHRFRSAGSDTETILAVYAEWGAEGFSRLRGMYAFAIWDELNRSLVLARDPYGIKPLYLSHRPDCVTFASQLRSLAADTAMPRDLDPAGVAGFALWGAVPEPFTILRAAELVPAGTWISFATDGTRREGIIEDIAQTMAEHEDDALGDPVLAVRDSLAAHMVADVEVGCFLSSGVDSSAIAGMMHDRTTQPVRAITLAFDEYDGTPADEAPLAREIGQLYGVTHSVERVTANAFIDALPNIVADMDQPSVDGVNTWLVSRAAKRAGLKVALSGLGGDELLAGYSTFRTVPRVLRAGRVLSAVRGAAAITGWALSKVYPEGKAALAPRYSSTLAQAYLLRRSMLLPEQLDHVLPPEIVKAGLARLQPIERMGELLDRGPREQTARIALLEATHYMRNQLLRDADWAGMAHSLEIRVPLVDVRLLAAMAAHQRAFGAARGSGKRILAQAPQTPLPASVVNRPKTGFQVPVAQWTSRGERVAKGSAGWARQILQHYVEGHGLSL